MVVDVPERSRFGIRVGDETAGFTEHLDLVPEEMRAKLALPSPMR